MWFTSDCGGFGEGILYIANLGGLKNDTIGKELLQAVRGARSEYFAHLSENKAVFETPGVDVVCYSVLLPFVLSFIQFFLVSLACV